MRIGIEINGVLRNTLVKIEQTYQKFLIDKTDGIEDEETFEYKMTYPINSLTLSEHFSQAMGDGGQLPVRQQQRLEYTIQLPYDLAIE